ncbi:MAG: hypothetical protein GX660_22020 [Clostridiaceae bacterium]|nr:hypothetical protein [Clostridiaceae bacterium]
MDYVHRLPYILGAFATIIIGMASYRSGLDSRTIYVRMSICMIVFFTVGLYIRGVLNDINIEIENRKAEQEALEESEKEETEGSDDEKGTQNKIDLTVDDNALNDSIKLSAGIRKLYDEEFSPLSVNNIKEDKEKK